MKDLLTRRKKLLMLLLLLNFTLSVNPLDLFQSNIGWTDLASTSSHCKEVDSGNSTEVTYECNQSVDVEGTSHEFKSTLKVKKNKTAVKKLKIYRGDDNSTSLGATMKDIAKNQKETEDAFEFNFINAHGCDCNDIRGEYITGDKDLKELANKLYANSLKKFKQIKKDEVKAEKERQKEKAEAEKKKKAEKKLANKKLRCMVDEDGKKIKRYSSDYYECVKLALSEDLLDEDNKKEKKIKRKFWHEIQSKLDYDIKNNSNLSSTFETINMLKGMDECVDAQRAHSMSLNMQYSNQFANQYQQRYQQNFLGDCKYSIPLYDMQNLAKYKDRLNNNARQMQNFGEFSQLGLINKQELLYNKNLLTRSGAINTGLRTDILGSYELAEKDFKSYLKTLNNSSDYQFGINNYSVRDILNPQLDGASRNSNIAKQTFPSNYSLPRVNVPTTAYLNSLINQASNKPRSVINFGRP